MYINRNNYEMYFLLYVDNELSAEERNAVQQFIVENPDLETELQHLQATSLPKEPIVFSGKKDLYKHELVTDNLQEKMFMLLDNELDASSALLLEKEINSSESLKREWNILQQTKLDAAEMPVFRHKASLYRHEKDNVVGIRFWRAAVAAAVIAAGIFIGISLCTKNKNIDAVAVTDKKQEPVKNTKPSIIITPSVNTNNDIEKNLAQPEENIASISSKENSKNISPVKKIDVVKKEDNGGDNKQLVKKETNNLPKPYYENINNPGSNEKLLSNVQDNIQKQQSNNEADNGQLKNTGMAQVNEKMLPLESDPNAETRNSFARNAVMNETAQSTSDNHILFINEDKVNRSKLGGLFKKVKRVITRNANLKSGNSVQIAGFEIAGR
jgi:hypothetical protein